MGLDVRFHTASGLTGDNACYLAMRYDEEIGFKPTCGDSWLVHESQAGAAAVYGRAGWFTGLWYSPQNHAYISSAHQEVIVIRDLPTFRENPKSHFDDPRWMQIHNLRYTMMGIFGLSDDYVLAWGNKDVGVGVMLLWNGQGWREIPSPGPDVTAVHGIAKDLIYAVGYWGLIARWDGAKWHKVSPITKLILLSVTVVSPDEIYACGDGGVLLDGSVHGWALGLQWPKPLYGVARFCGDLWVGAQKDGLMKRDRDTLIPVKPNIKAELLEARQHLIISAAESTCYSEDGRSFKGQPDRGVLYQNLIAAPTIGGW